MRRLHEVPPELLALAATQGGLVSAQDCTAHGVSPNRRAALVGRGQWRRVTRGVFDTVAVPTTQRPPGVRRLRAAWCGLLAYGPDAVAVGASACVLLGIEGTAADAPPEVALPGGASVRSRDGIVLRQYDAGMRAVRVGSRLVAAPEWAVAQVVPRSERDRAVAVMDSALCHGLLDPAGLGLAHDHARRRRGVERTHGWWALATPLAESPLETLGRLDCLDVGVPPDELQVSIRGRSGEPLGRGDTGWRLPGGRWLVGEMDGREQHVLPVALLHDRSRQNDFVVLGSADVLRFTWRDIGPAHRIGRTVAAYLDRTGYRKAG